MEQDQRFNIKYTVDKPLTNSWNGFVGYVTKEMIQKVFPSPSNDILMTFCGNKAMRKLVFDLFEDIGYNPKLTGRF